MKDDTGFRGEYLPAVEGVWGWLGVVFVVAAVGIGPVLYLLFN